MKWDGNVWDWSELFGGGKRSCHCEKVLARMYDFNARYLRKTKVLKKYQILVLSTGRYCPCDWLWFSQLKQQIISTKRLWKQLSDGKTIFCPFWHWKNFIFKIVFRQVCCNGEKNYENNNIDLNSQRVLNGIEVFQWWNEFF